MLVDFGLPVSNLTIDEGTKTNLPIKHYYEKLIIEKQQNGIKNWTFDSAGSPMSSSGGPIGADGTTPIKEVVSGDVPPREL